MPGTSAKRCDGIMPFNCPNNSGKELYYRGQYIRKSMEGQNKEMIGWGLKNPILLFCLNLRPSEARAFAPYHAITAQ